MAPKKGASKNIVKAKPAAVMKRPAAMKKPAAKSDAIEVADSNYSGHLTGTEAGGLISSLAGGDGSVTLRLPGLAAAPEPIANYVYSHLPPTLVEYLQEFQDPFSVRPEEAYWVLSYRSTTSNASLIEMSRYFGEDNFFQIRMD